MAILNPDVRYVTDGEDFTPGVMERQVKDIEQNLNRIQNQMEQRLLNIDASQFTTGVIAPIRLPTDTDGVPGAVMKATDAEVVAGEENTKYVTAKQANEKAEQFSGRTGVALQGNPIIVAGSSGTYDITNYNSFSVYSVAVSPGSVTRTNDEIEVTIPGGSSGIATLTVTKDGRPFVFQISIGASGVARPTITRPTQGSNNFSILEPIRASQFTTIPTGADTHLNTDWQVATDSGFTNIVAQSLTDTVNLTSWTPSPALSIGTTYYARVRYRGNSIQDSPWSETRSFETASLPNTPTLTAPTGGATEVGETPVLASSDFSSPVAETHSASDWEIRKQSDDALVWSSYVNSANKTSISIPGGVLQPNTAYKARVRHIGSVLGASNWSAFNNFTTQETFFIFGPESAGMPFGGGFYAGGNIIIDGMLYALIVSPQNTGEATRAFRNSSSSQPLNDEPSLFDGYHNTYTILTGSNYPAAAFCRGLTIAGHSDWYLPSKAELEVCYRYLKPGNTANSTATTSFGRLVNAHSLPLGFTYTSNNPRYSTNPYHAAFNAHKFLIDSSSSTANTVPPSGSSTVALRTITVTTTLRRYWHSTYDHTGFQSQRTKMSRFDNGAEAYDMGVTSGYSSDYYTEWGDPEEQYPNYPFDGSPYKWRQTRYRYIDTAIYRVRAIRKHLIGPV